VHNPALAARLPRGWAWVRRSNAMTLALNRGAAFSLARATPGVNNPVGGSESIKSAFGLVGDDPPHVGVNNTAMMPWPAMSARTSWQMVSPYMPASDDDNVLISGIPGAVRACLVVSAPADAGLARTALGAAGTPQSGWCVIRWSGCRGARVAGRLALSSAGQLLAGRWSVAD